MQKRPHLQHLSALGAVKPFCWGFGKLTLVLDREHKTWGMKLSKKFSTGRRTNACWREQEEVEERWGTWHLKMLPFPPHLLNALLFNNAGRVFCFVGKVRFVAIYILFPTNIPRNCYWGIWKSLQLATYFRESLGSGKSFFPDFHGNTPMFFRIPGKWKNVSVMLFLQISPCSLRTNTYKWSASDLLSVY